MDDYRINTVAPVMIAIRMHDLAGNRFDLAQQSSWTIGSRRVVTGNRRLVRKQHPQQSKEKSHRLNVLLARLKSSDNHHMQQRTKQLAYQRSVGHGAPIHTSSIVTGTIAQVQTSRDPRLSAQVARQILH